MTDEMKFVTAAFLGLILNIKLHQNMMRFIRFRQIENAILTDKIDEIERTTGIQYMAHFMMFYPISSGIVLLLLLDNIYISVGCLLAIWVLTIIGKVSKYRTTLYLHTINEIEAKMTKSQS